MAYSDDFSRNTLHLLLTLDLCCASPVKNMLHQSYLFVSTTDEMWLSTYHQLNQEFSLIQLYIN